MDESSPSSAPRDAQENASPPPTRPSDGLLKSVVNVAPKLGKPFGFALLLVIVLGLVAPYIPPDYTILVYAVAGLAYAAYLANERLRHRASR